MPDRSAQLRALETCWRHEVLTKPVEAEVRHAARWADRIREAGGRAPDAAAVKPALGLSLQVAPPEVIFRKLGAHEQQDAATHEGLAGDLDQAGRTILRDIVADDHEHARILRVLAGPESPRTALDLILKRERHVRGTGSATASTAVGGLIPVLPFLWAGSGLRHPLARSIHERARECSGLSELMTSTASPSGGTAFRALPQPVRRLLPHRVIENGPNPQYSRAAWRILRVRAN